MLGDVSSEEGQGVFFQDVHSFEEDQTCAPWVCDVEGPRSREEGLVTVSEQECPRKGDRRAPSSDEVECMLLDVEAGSGEDLVPRIQRRKSTASRR